MRFLLEAYPVISKDIQDEFRSANDKRKKEIIQDLLYKWHKPELNILADVLVYSGNLLGINPIANKFFDLFDELKFNPIKNHISNFFRLVDYYNKERINLDKDWLKEPEIYEVPTKDFDYTIKLFDIVSDSNKINKFFQDTNNISLDQLYDKSGKIKPAGNAKTSKDLNTLFGTVESWSGEEGENDIPIVTSNSMDFTKNYKALTTNGLKLDKAESIYNEMKNLSSDQLDDKYKKDGNIIFLKELIDPKNSRRTEVNSFYIFRNNAWQPYENTSTYAVKHKHDLI